MFCRHRSTHNKRTQSIILILFEEKLKKYDLEKKESIKRLNQTDAEISRSLSAINRSADQLKLTVQRLDKDISPAPIGYLDN